MKQGGQGLPEHVQRMILAAVRYPLQARRHGWQGRAEFRLTVREQKLGAIEQLASTGYPLLDRAARQGIASVGNLPLSDGRYRLPVVFRLQ